MAQLHRLRHSLQLQSIDNYSSLRFGLESEAKVAEGLFFIKNKKAAIANPWSSRGSGMPFKMEEHSWQGRLFRGVVDLTTAELRLSSRARPHVISPFKVLSSPFRTASMLGTAPSLLLRRWSRLVPRRLRLPNLLLASRRRPDDLCKSSSSIRIPVDAKAPANGEPVAAHSIALRR